MQAENVMLRDTVEFLGERLACAERRLQAAHIRKPYSLAERLHILWCIEYFGIPRRQIAEDVMGSVTAVLRPPDHFMQAYAIAPACGIRRKECWLGPCVCVEAP